MTLLEFKTKLHSELEQIYPKDEIDTFYKLLIAHQLNYSSADSALNQQKVIPSEKLDFLFDAVDELANEKPIQYIIGETEFYGLSFKVNEDTLIPRPETEELVHWILKEIETSNKKSNLRILDIGTGSGCIAITLAKHIPNVDVYAIDVSKNALEMATINAQSNDVAIDFIHANILKTSNLSELISNTFHFDIIVSNPPYVRNLEKEEMQANVLQYEPHQALFVKDKNPLLFYDKIAELSVSSLSENGFLFFEINQYLHKETVQLLKEKKYTSIDLKKDLFDNFRMIKASL